MPGHPWDNPNADDVYNFATIIVGCAIVGDNIVFVGSHGYGAPCYGDGTSDPDAADGVHVCYDPASSSKSNHAYPYRLQLWHYPLSELARVAAGEIEPWSMVPDWFELTVPFKQLTHQCNGCAFDPETNRLYVSMFAADGYGYEPGPIIYAWEFTGGGAEPPDPPDPDQDEQIKKLQKTVLALTAALAKERQAHAVLKATVHAEAVTIADADVRILKATSPEKK
jgi:hypothetical protein